MVEPAGPGGARSRVAPRLRWPRPHGAGGRAAAAAPTDLCGASLIARSQTPQSNVSRIVSSWIMYSYFSRPGA